MIDLDEDDLRQMCTESSFYRGERYFEEGRVRIKEATTTRVKAVVSGTNDYQVEIELDEEFSGECDCPYDWDGLCKHIVATFLAVIRDDAEIEPLMKKSSCELEDTKHSPEAGRSGCFAKLLALRDGTASRSSGIGLKPSSAKKAREEA